MLKLERQDRILDLLASSGRVVAAELPGELGVSGYTVRRDLEELAEAGRLRRVHGGAVARSSVAATYGERARQAVPGKREVARAAVTLLDPGSVAIVDGGTTALHLVEQIPDDHTGTIVTHSPPVAAALAGHRGVDVVVIGGSLDRQAMVAVGATTIAAYEAIAADVCFLGVWSLSPSGGVSSRYYEEARVRAAMVARADRVVALCTRDKLGTVAAFESAPASAVTHIATEAATPDAALAPFIQLGIRVVRPAA